MKCEVKVFFEITRYEKVLHGNKLQYCMYLISFGQHVAVILGAALLISCLTKASFCLTRREL